MCLAPNSYTHRRDQIFKMRVRNQTALKQLLKSQETRGKSEPTEGGDRVKTWDDFVLALPFARVPDIGFVESGFSISTLSHTPESPSRLKFRRSPVRAPPIRREIRFAKMATACTHIAHANTTGR